MSESDEKGPQGVNGAQADGGAEEISRTEKLKRFAKQHPEATLVAAAGASALLAGEFAVGALVGVGAALLVTRASGADWRKRLRELLGSTKESARGWIHRVAPGQTAAPPTS